MSLAPGPVAPGGAPGEDEAPFDYAAVVEPLRPAASPFRWIVWAGFVVVIAAILASGALGWWYLGRVNPGVAADGPVTFVVEETDTFDTVTQRLLDDGVIVDAGVFRWYVERNGGLELTPGYYQLIPGDHVGNVLGRLRTPPARTFNRVTFPEGFTVAQMGSRLGSTIERMTAEGFAAAATSGRVRPQYLPLGQVSLEGLLFPDTYQVSNSESEAQVVERMVANMERVGRQEDLEARAADLGMTPYEVLIVASMIEREAKLDEDRARISAVIQNRLSIGMPLQIDATVYYGQDPSTPFPILRRRDFPHNTYLHPGLPPTPIANPGRASIRAALSPAPPPPPSDPVCRELPDPTTCHFFYYVLADERGGHAFAATLEQHEANIQRAREAGVL